MFIFHMYFDVSVWAKAARSCSIAIHASTCALTRHTKRQYSKHYNIMLTQCYLHMRAKRPRFSFNTKYVGSAVFN